VKTGCALVVVEVVLYKAEHLHELDHECDDLEMVTGVRLKRLSIRVDAEQAVEADEAVAAQLLAGQLALKAWSPHGETLGQISNVGHHSARPDHVTRPAGDSPLILLTDDVSGDLCIVDIDLSSVCIVGIGLSGVGPRVNAPCGPCIIDYDSPSGGREIQKKAGTLMN
jgi:hypothetical protein